jgi:hypothetical protein
VPVKAEAPIYKPKPEESKQPEPKIIYVPQVIEKVYVREVVRTEHVVYHEPQREYQQASYQPTSYQQTNRDTQDYSCCSSFTGEAKDNCQRTVREGGTCQQYQAKITYYRFQN